MNADELAQRQTTLCVQHGASPNPVQADQRLGIARTVREGIVPVHGMRMRPGRGTTGWYIWAGDCSDDPDFFVAIHVRHLPEWCPLYLSSSPYLLSL